MATLEERQERFEIALKYFLSDRGSYHNHKETMAHAALVVMILVTGGVLSKEWPPDWLRPIEIFVSGPWVAFSAFFLGWMLIHIFIRYQLRNKRAASVISAAALHALLQWINTDLTEEKLEPLKCPSVARKAPKWANALDYIIPFQWASAYIDVPEERYPSAIVEAIRELERKQIYKIGSEWFVTLGSILLLVIAFFRTILAP